MKSINYSKELDLISEKLDKGIADSQVFEKLEYLYNIKPVSMRWHYLKCKALLKSGQTADVVKQFGDKISREYIFEWNLELWQQLIEAYRINGQELEGDRQNYMLSKLTKSEFYVNIDNELRSARQKFVEGDETEDNLKQLESLYYKACNRLMAYCVYLYGAKKFPQLRDTDRENMYVNIDNMGYLAEYIADKKTVIIVTDKEENENYDILSYILHSLEVPVYMINDVIPVEGDYSLAATVEVSMDNRQEFEDCVAVPAVAQIIENQYAGDNIPYIIDYLCKHETEDDFGITIASNSVIEKLRTHKDISKRFERLSCYEANYIENEIGFGRAGDYYTYIGRLYRQNVKELVEREPECDFSIVVPVRNVTDTLYHTLRTCLEQDYDGTYEVVVSDNSTEGNTVAYDICNRLNDKRIKYYKTPRDLYLTKSFEYAYLQAKGRYIISVGADDGVLPWALKTLNVVWNVNNTSDIVCWDRGFYAWPGFNGGQQNQFAIPNYYKKGDIRGNIQSTEDYKEVIKNDASYMYMLPNMYINSGYARRYLKTLYEKTGMLLDGASQDIYMGLVNIAINEKILRIQYPITIAGMSNSSVGNNSIQMQKNDSDKLKQQYNGFLGGKGICAYIKGNEAQDYPMLGTDVCGMYMSIARLIAKNILSSDFYKSQEEVKRRFIQCYESISIMNGKYVLLVLEGYEVAKRISEEFKSWYEANILVTNKRLRFIDAELIEKNRQEKTYEEGFTADGGVVLDASRYGVTNIYEAVQLFKDFLHF